MKKIKYLFYSLLVSITALNFSPTFCKYAIYGYVGVAGNLIFSTLTFITETFVVYEDGQTEPVELTTTLVSNGIKKVFSIDVDAADNQLSTLYPRRTAESLFHVT